MTPEDWQRDYVLAVCKGCRRFGKCSAVLVASMVMDGGCWLKEEEE